MNLLTRTHPSTRAEKTKPKKVLSGPQKGLSNLEKGFFASTVRNSMGLYIRIVFTSFAPQPMDGYGGVLGPH